MSWQIWKEKTASSFGAKRPVPSSLIVESAGVEDFKNCFNFKYKHEKANGWCLPTADFVKVNTDDVSNYARLGANCLATFLELLASGFKPLYLSILLDL